jgi:peroxiredoxin
MMRQRLPLLVLACVGALFGAVAAALVLSASQPSQPGPTSVQSAQVKSFRVREGQLAPDFTLNTFDGKPVTIADFRGKRVLVNFWAAWCPPCVAETKDLISAYGELKDKGVEFIGIGTDDKFENLKSFADNSAIPYTILVDENGKVGSGWGVLGLPMSVVLDEKGIVTRVKPGAVTKAEVLNWFK